MGEINKFDAELVQLARLALDEKTGDVRLYIARIARKYRSVQPELTEKLESFLRAIPAPSGAPLRKNNQSFLMDKMIPIDEESKLSLLKVFADPKDRESPLLSADLTIIFSQLINERQEANRLLAAGLSPTRSAIFIGRPGLGKTITARWLAARLGVPLYVLDLTAVMSSLLGKSGSNLRTALDFAKTTPCVLLLDEIDAIAKRRGDDADIGELKRLVTVILQEVDEWPASGLLLAATNHPELIDPALWRRFDLQVEFKSPEPQAVKDALRRFFGPDLARFSRWIDLLAIACNGQSFSDIERTVNRFRRALILERATEEELVNNFIKTAAIAEMDRQARVEFAVQIAKQTTLSQHAISEVTGVSRDTIRKHTATIKTT